MKMPSWLGSPNYTQASQVALVVKNPPTNVRRHKRRRFNPWVRKIPWSRAWQPIPVFLPMKSHGQRSLGDYSLCVGKESATTKRTHTNYTHVIESFNEVYLKGALKFLLFYWKSVKMHKYGTRILGQLGEVSISNKNKISQKEQLLYWLTISFFLIFHLDSSDVDFYVPQ